MRRILIALALISSPALAQRDYGTGEAGIRVPGVVPLQCNAAGTVCTPATAANPASTQGSVAAGSVDSGNPVKIGGLANEGSPVAVDSGDRVDAWFGVNGQVFATLTDDVGSQIVDSNGILVQYGLGQWTYASGTTGILSNTTTAVTFKTAAGAGVRNFVTSCQLSTTAFTTSVPIAIRNGAGGPVLWAVNVPTQGFLTPLAIVFQTPLRGSANTLLEVVTTTANTTGSVMINCQGHTGA